MSDLFNYYCWKTWISQR